MPRLVNRMKYICMDACWISFEKKGGSQPTTRKFLIYLQKSHVWLTNIKSSHWYQVCSVHKYNCSDHQDNHSAKKYLVHLQNPVCIFYKYYEHFINNSFNPSSYSTLHYYFKPFIYWNKITEIKIQIINYKLLILI